MLTIKLDLLLESLLPVAMMSGALLVTFICVLVLVFMFMALEQGAKRTASSEFTVVSIDTRCAAG